MRRIIIAAACMAAALIGAGPALAAPAAVVSAAYTGPVTSGSSLAGYQVFGNGLDAFNDARATFTEAAGTSSNSAVYLQAQANTGGLTAELALVHGTPACPGAASQLEAGVAAAAAPGPLALAALTTSLGPVTCVPDGTPFYLEIHYSTLLRTVAFVAGPSEFGDANTLASVPVGFAEFRSPADGAHYTATALPVEDAPQLSVTRVGVTRLLDPAARRGGTDSRLTLNALSTQRVEATVDGGAPTVGSPVFLQATPMGTGSAFAVTAAS
jgi:hypothetical protein